MQTCNHKLQPQKTKEIIRVDSVYNHTTDTFVRKIYVQTKSIQYIDSSKIDSVSNGYIYEGKDSLLNYSIFVQSKERPFDVKLKYDVKQFTIHDSVNVYVKDSVYNEVRKSYMSAGAIIQGGNKFGFSPVISYNHKKGNSYFVGYDLFNKNLQIGFTKRISFKK
jgi:hypothetical protein